MEEPINKITFWEWCKQFPMGRADTSVLWRLYQLRVLGRRPEELTPLVRGGNELLVAS